MTKDYLDNGRPIESRFEHGKMINFLLDNKGSIRKRVGWINFRGMVSVLKTLNKQCKKLKYSAVYTVRLPLK